MRFPAASLPCRSGLPFAPTAALPGAMLALALALPLGAQDHHHAHDHGPGDGQLLGSVSFPISCSDAVQPAFDEAVAMLHSFWFAEADEAFRAVAEADPDCGMAHWGRAMTAWGNPMARGAPPAPRTALAREALAAARDRMGTMTEKERAWLRAAEVLFDEAGLSHHLDRMAAHEAVLEEMRAAYPDDPEILFFYGRIVVANAPPDDLTFQRQLHAASVMEPLVEEHPDHPGLIHYLIHAFDAPPIAEHGLEAALRYAEIAPSAPHALHMPSHIFTRLGYWEESIATNARSAQAEPDPDAAVHPMDYMVYAHLQLGQDRAAGEIVARAREIDDTFYTSIIGYNFAAMTTRYALERNRWDEAMGLPIPPTAPAWVEAIPRFGRALGAARSGAPERADGELAHMEELLERLHAEGEDYWAVVVEAQRRAAEAWVLHARGDRDGAVALALAAAELEETVEKHPVTPGPLLPARELLGDLLLEVGDAAAARAAYEATLVREPRRARALFGAARAAEAAGDEAGARAHYRELLDLLEKGDPDRPDRRAAEEALARNR
jgi:tetratricopeptide (TPR) repeat protein